MLDGFIRLKKCNFTELKPLSDKGLIVMNPPYGERLKEDEITLLYKEIGDTLKRNFTGHEAWVLSGNPGALKYIGLHPEKKIELLNGSIKCKFQKFSIYQGSKRRNSPES
jgi:putative N6-adenine-specific DNA methylase